MLLVQSFSSLQRLSFILEVIIRVRKDATQVMVVKGYM